MCYRWNGRINQGRFSYIADRYGRPMTSQSRFSPLSSFRGGQAIGPHNRFSRAHQFGRQNRFQSRRVPIFRQNARRPGRFLGHSSDNNSFGSNSDSNRHNIQRQLRGNQRRNSRFRHQNGNSDSSNQSGSRFTYRG